jgi:hypothetical protein
MQVMSAGETFCYGKVTWSKRGKDHQSQLSFMSYYYVILVLHVLISVNKGILGKIRISKKNCHVNYIKPLFMSIYI